MLKWIVNKGDYKGTYVVIVKVNRDKCLCFDRRGCFYWFRKSDLSIPLSLLMGGMNHGNQTRVS